MSETHTTYTPKEILQILNDLYLFQSEYCNNGDVGHTLSFETSIESWRNICDLLNPVELAKAHHEFFDLETDETELETILKREQENTLKEYCEYIAQNAKRETITLSVSLGGKCLEAGILNSINQNLKKRGVNIKELKASNNFPLLFKKYPSEFIEIVSKLAPGTISYYDIQENRISKAGGYLFLISLLVLVVALISGKLSWLAIIPFGVSVAILNIGRKIEPLSYEIGGFNTVKDLVVGIKANLNIEKT
ncbi:hypothetical protein EYV94_27250 [Puteibacter caeruleilacunae]|nr:hypothetical protein EYV94_27250 [Puteibacter caeruleilacunae]